MKSANSRRASIVRESISTWGELIEYNFNRRYFVDDRSIDFSGINVLGQSDIGEKFDQILFFPFSHSQHSNFGIVYSIEVANSDYVLHIDDDVVISGTKLQLEDYINKCVDLLNNDKSILGINILTLDPNLKYQKPWMPDAEYVRNNKLGFSHPKRYFGTCACIVRRELLNLVSLNDIVAYGSEQPAHWERIVSQDKFQFLVANVQTPFDVHPDAWSFTATSKSKVERLAKKALRQLRGIR